MTAPQRLACLMFLVAAGLSMAACSSNGTKSLLPSPTQPVGDFSLAANPNTVSLNQGGNATVTVTVTAVNGLSGNVNVALSGLPVGVTASPASPFSAAVGSTTSVTLAAAANANLGPALLSFQGTEGSLNHSASTALNVGAMPNFGIAIAPGSVSLTQGSQSKPVSVVITPLNQFSGNVAVSLAGLPAGISASTGNSFSISAGSAQTITFNAATTAAPGTASLTVQGSSGSLNHSANAALQVQAAVTPDFGMAVLPGFVAVTQGGKSRPVTISNSVINGFSGDVAVSISGLPSGITASPASFSIPAGGKQAVVFSVPATATPGPATLTFTGTGGSTTHSVSANFQTLEAPCTGDCADEADGAAYSRNLLR